MAGLERCHPGGYDVDSIHSLLSIAHNRKHVGHAFLRLLKQILPAGSQRDVVHRIVILHAMSFLLGTLFEISSSTTYTLNTYFASQRWLPFLEAELFAKGEGLSCCARA